MRDPLPLPIVLTVGLLLVAPLDAQATSDTGNLRYSISVEDFPNESSWRGRWNLGQGFTTIMTDLLQESGRFIVLGDSAMRGAAIAEQDFAASGRAAGGKKAPKIGRMTPAQLLVRGSITHVQETGGGKGGINFRGISIGGGGSSAEVNITMYLVNTETGQVAASTKVTGTSGKRGLGLGYAGSQLGGLTGKLSGFTKDNVGKACEDAVRQGVAFMIEQLESIAWEGSVMLIKGDQIVINRGTREGVTQGMVFEVGEVEELVDPDTGEVLDSDMSTVAELEAVKVKEKITYTKAISGGPNVRKGMTVFAR